MDQSLIFKKSFINIFHYILKSDLIRSSAQNHNVDHRMIGKKGEKQDFFEHFLNHSCPSSQSVQDAKDCLKSHAPIKPIHAKPNVKIDFHKMQKAMHEKMCKAQATCLNR